MGDTTATEDTEFDLESLVHLEQTFYDQGYKEGFDHGRIHGLIEGRALGREKGFEMWEELAFYEGFALVWKSVYPTDSDASQSQTGGRRTIANHISQLLHLISQFPRTNPSPEAAAENADLDIVKLQSQIRSRYKTLCAALGVKPSLRGGASDGTEELDPALGQEDAPDGVTNVDGEGDGNVVLATASGPKKKSVWAVQPPPNQQLSF